ncbi:protein meaA [Leptospira sp. 2 VSF19]|uniref:Protein meaA n=1 Tax=Leptospira soteropolitanensis TaxID=2950025 RepID=A0AAW5VJT7_9LEPT|nr:protein meaA [Leptospira soteropolitanensis]MCW7492747.1 protein meaA [Leptospira soteropolitanensis]MCW7500430.1 protein meaA [Leptospira soteropolitanensis]MCW7522535.1 protein meaA [Leptospira soteropolitanensis]MCW7526391.1 protein meaA [Leptospira soteropolitanensis]MCW7530400.1 protein meaA [Leptospira soteropolitanensis]
MSAEKKDYLLVDENGQGKPDKPWIFRTYAGHTNAKASNELYRKNLSKGQTGLSIAFDLPTQCGYSSDHEVSRPEIGKVGVPINSLEDFRILFDQIPIEEMNTSMTINGTSMWLLSLYVALAEERGVPLEKLNGTTQNDLIKEYLARGTYIYPPKESMKIIVDMYEYCLHNIPKWNPSNICSYHLQEAGATPVQELSFALATAIAVLDAIKERNCFTADEFEQCVGRISFFVNAGIRFVEEMCKMRAFTEMWEEITKERYGVKTAKYRVFRYGVQVNSLGLTEEQPENNAWRILIESLGVTLSRNARCRALQLPAWNEALSLPRPWDQQWSLRLQQVLAYETDLLEYPDIFEGSKVIESKVKALKEEAKLEIQKIIDMGGALVAIENGYMKSQLVKSQTERLSKINSNELVIVGKNKWTDGIKSPLMTDSDGGIFKVDPKSAEQTLNVLADAKSRRNAEAAKKSIEDLKKAAKEGKNLMPFSIACAKALVTTGEWADALREVYGEYNPPTGVDGQKLFLSDDKVSTVRGKVEAFTKANGHRPKIVVGKPGLDGHSNGAEMIAVSAKHSGFDVIYSGIRLSPEEIVQSAVEENANVIGLSILSGSHKEIVKQLFDELAHYKAKIPVVIGGIIPESDFEELKKMGIREIFTPKDYDLMSIMEKIIDIVSVEPALV